MDHHSDGSIWTAGSLVEALIADHLHRGYSAVTYRGVVIAREGYFRTFDRLGAAPDMTMKSDQGRFAIRTRPDNPEYAEWLENYRKRGAPDAHEKACAMCVFSLQQRLDRFDGGGKAHIIYPEDFLVERLV